MRLPSALTLSEIQQSFRDVDAIIAPFAGALPVDWKGRRLVNVLDAVNPADVVTLRQLNAAIDAIDGDEEENAQDGVLTTGTGKVRSGLYDSRGAPTAHRGEWYIATDHGDMTWFSDGATWNYIAGVMYGTLSPNQKPTLVAGDVGFLFGSTDFSRIYKWSGSAWEDAPGQDARGYVQFHDVTLHAAFAPGAGWQLCDGSSVTRSAPDGSTTSVTVPNLTTDNRYLRSVSGATGGTSGAATHTHAVDPASTASGGPSATTEVQSGTGTTVASDGHTHNTDIASFTSGSGSSLPPSYDVRPYFRL